MTTNPQGAEPDRGQRVELIDLSHPIRGGMVTYPGLPGPVIGTHLSREESRERYEEGTEFHIGNIEMVANTGTYLDAPFHRYADGADLAGIRLESLLGVPGVVVETERRVIDRDVFSETAIGGRAVLVATGWDHHFESPDYLGEHPHLTEEAARLLVDEGAALVGIDSANIDDTSRGLRPAHSLLLGAGIPVVEHLANLHRIGGRDFEFFAVPPPIIGLGTFPVRAVARVELDEAAS